MYNRLFNRFGLDAVYLAFDVDPEHAHTVADIIRVMGLDGVNLTVPFKEMLLDQVDTSTAAAREAGAVNVVTHLDGALMGYNTDGEGFVRSLAEEDGPNIEGLTAIILGAGGAARAVASGLLDRGAKRLHILNRTVRRAEMAAEALSTNFPDATISAESLCQDVFAAHANDSLLVVNCTSGPADKTIAAFEPSRLASGASWVDINYWMPHPPCQDKCQAAGVKFHDGLGMLAHQGALAFELFTGYPVTGAELRAFLAEQA